MTDTEKITNVQALIGPDDAATDALISVYLSEAKDDILQLLFRAYGGVPDGAEMPSTYDFLQCKLAVRKFLRRGAEGETAHTENGIGRTYGSADDADLLCRVIPYARVGAKPYTPPTTP